MKAISVDLLIDKVSIRKNKRIFDICLALILLVFISPIYLLISILLLREKRGPILFRQTRVGLNGKNFEILKFRTMVPDAEKVGMQITIGSDQRITKFGAFLRRFKLDELPQLYNVLRGDMSFVGPRPEVPYYVQFYTPEQRQILYVLPGITDMASIKYVQESDLLAQANDPEKHYLNVIMPDKIRMNIEYSAQASFWSDLKVLFLTAKALFL